MRPIDMIVVHCTATPEGRDETVASITKMHQARGWRTIGYHWVVYRDGTIHAGRPESEVGAHVAGYNLRSIGIVYVGGVAKDAKTPKDTRTQAQKVALREFLSAKMRQYPKARLVGHRDLSPDLNKDGVIEPREWIKACPSFDVATEYGELFPGRVPGKTKVPADKKVGLK